MGCHPPPPPPPQGGARSSTRRRQVVCEESQSPPATTHRMFGDNFPFRKWGPSLRHDGRRTSAVTKKTRWDALTIHSADFCSRPL